MARYAYRGRHRTPDTSGTALRSAALGAGVVAAVMVGSAAPATATPDSSDPWYRLRMCESGGNYRINTGNGYYGAYQFNIGTWRAYGGTGLPHQASPAEQDHRARLLYQARGWSPWPACSRKLGLRNDPAYGRTGSAPARASRSTARTAPAATLPRPTTLQAPAVLVRGQAMTLRGTARPGARVAVYTRYADQSRYRLLRTVRASATGSWTTVAAPSRSARYVAVSGGRSSATAATRVVYRATVTGPVAVGLDGTYRISGTARPNSRVLVRLKHPGTARWKYATVRRTDSAGRWSMVWRGWYDYEYSVVGEANRPVHTTRIATTASTVAAPRTPLSAPAARPAVTVTGTARPRSSLVVYVRTPGGSFRAYRTFTSGASGHWTRGFRAPAASFQYYVKSSNGLRSPVRSVRA
jgi:hypothetical protein